MNKIFIKSIVLTVSVALFSFQILLFWTYNFSGDLMKYGSGITETVVLKEKSYLLISDSVELFYQDTIGYTIDRITQDYDEVYDKSIISMMQILKDSSTVSYSVEEINYLEFNSVFFKLELPLNKRLFVNEFGGNLTDFSGVEYIYDIGVLKSSDGSRSIVYLSDYDKNEILCFETKKTAIVDDFTILETVSGNLNTKNYSRVELVNQDNLDFTKRLIAPLPSEDLVFDIDLLFEVPYVHESVVNETAVDNFVNGFFENSAVKWKNRKNDKTIEYGDDSVIVSYSSNGLFEYSKIVADNNNSINISDAYNIVEEFLVIDSKIIDLERILKGYVLDGDKITFYYEYSQEGFPIIMNSETMKNNNMDYPMMVTVENNSVTVYKRFLLQREDFMPQKTYLESDYKDILERFYGDYGVDSSGLNDIYLGYYYKEDNYLEMKWIIKYDGVIYVYNAF